jgi:indolepyruvate ferredoxin oxidoreductase
MGSGAGSKQPRYAELLTSIIHSAFHVLYDKDEYEVARLYGTPEFKRQLEREFEGNYRLKVHLAPPIISQLDPATGRPKKREFGAWIFSLFSILGMLRRIRGRWFDPFRHSSERVLARDMQSRFATTVADLCVTPIDNENFDTALALARWPQAVKGYGPVRMAAAAKAVENCAKLTQQLSVMRQSRQVA